MFFLGVQPMQATKQEFKTWQDKHPNFITDKLLKVETVGPYVVELSEDSSHNHDMWGVTTAKKIGTAEFRTDDDKLPDGVTGKPFHDKQEAKDYFQDMVDKLQDATEQD